MKYAILLSSIFACSCLSSPAFVTNHGVKVYCDSRQDCYSQGKVEAATNIVIDKLVQNFPDKYSYSNIFKIMKEQSGWHKVYFVKSETGPEGSCATYKNSKNACQGFRCDGGDTGWCRGLHIVTKFKYPSRLFHRTRTELSDQRYSNIYIAKVSNCIAGTAFVHELIHFFQSAVENKADPKHSSDKMWSSACYENDKECLKSAVNRQAEWEVFMKLCGGNSYAW